MSRIDFKFIEENFYYFHLNDHPNKIYSIVLSKLHIKEVMDEFIDIYGTRIRALNSEVPATYFCGAYGWFLSGIQYVLSYYETSFNVSLSNIELQIYYDEQRNYYGIFFRLLDSSEVSPILINGNSWRKGVLEKMYLTNVVPIVNLLHEASNVRMKDLYGQISLGIYNGYDRMLMLAQTETQKDSVQSDFNFLTKELDPEIFQLKKNPFSINFRMIESPTDEGVLIRMKPSCCLYYQTEGATTKCYGCPRISDEERKEQRKRS